MSFIEAEMPESEKSKLNKAASEVCGLTIVGSIVRIRSLCDGGVRLELDLPESAGALMGQLYGLRETAVRIILQPLRNGEGG